MIFVGGVVAPIGGAVTAVSLPAVGIMLSVLGFVAMGVGTGLSVSGRAGNGHPPPPDPARVHVRRCPGAPDWKSGSRLFGDSVK